MGTGNAVIRAAALCGLALGVLTTTGLAQKPAQRPEKSVKLDVRERALEKLRALERASRPVSDSLAAARPDSAAPDAAPAARVDSTAGRAARDSIAPKPAPVTTAPAAAVEPVIVHLPPDSLATALRNLDGYALTEYRADDRARFDADSSFLQLIGSPSLNREGQGIRADSLLVYDERRATLCGYGKPVMEGTEGEPVESDQVCYNIDRRTGVAMGARTKFTENATWFVHGQELFTRGNDRVYGADTDFTSCDIETPHYHFAAKSVKIVHDRILVARDVTLRFQDVPVFWLPFMVQSLKRGRRSGLLTPQFSLTDIVRNSTGYDRKISNLGFYWAMNDYMDAKVAMEWYSQHWTALHGGLQYSWLRQFLRGYVDFTRYWREDGSTELSLQTSHNWQPGENTTLSVNGNFVAREFVEQFSFDPQQLDRSIQSSAGLSHRFDWGSLNITANRSQYLDNDQTTMTLPSASLTLSPITLFPAAGETHWYNNASWNASTNFVRRRSDLNELSRGANNRDSEERTGSISSNFQMGKFTWTQSANFREDMRGSKPLIPDTAAIAGVDEVALARERMRTMNWSTALGFSQRLIGTSTFSPSLSLGGEVLESDSTGGRPIAGPTRLTFGASLNTNIYGFWPGFGPFARLRHRIDPSLSYSYSPVPRSTERQREAFGESAGTETNRLTLGIKQTWEAKYATQDTTADPSSQPDTSAAALSGEPRRLPQARKITLLSVRTTAMVYDFAKARAGDYGFTTAELSHNISSDLLQGLTFTIRHDLFRFEDAGEDVRPKRVFAPRIRRIDTSFSLDNDSWLFRALGLGRRSEPADTAAADTAAADTLTAGADPLGRRNNAFMTPGRAASNRPAGPVGSWRADLSYSLIRPAAGSVNGRESQLLRGTVSFQPTEHWSVNWRTGYSITDHEFSDHYLTLSRDIHRWQANFDFVKMRNGNFMFSFRVHLLDNQDIKLDYDERYEGPAARGPR